MTALFNLIVRDIRKVDVGEDVEVTVVLRQLADMP